MSLYNPGVPTGTVNLDVDYQSLQNNFSQLDTTYGVDHYKFSNRTGKNGFHNSVTTPIYSTAATPQPGVAGLSLNPLIFGFQYFNTGLNPSLGTLQFSIAPTPNIPSNAVPSPITIIQSIPSGSTLVHETSLNMLNITGLTSVILKVFAYNIRVKPPEPVAFLEYTVFSNGASINITPIITDTLLSVVSSGNIIQLRNSGTFADNDMSHLFWSIQLIRVA